MAGNTSEPGASVLARAVAILDCFSETDSRLGLGELSERSGLASSTTHRLVTDLVRHGMLQRHADRRFTIGTRVWELGALAEVSLHLREPSLPYLLELYEATGENVHMAVLSGWEALYVTRLLGPRPVPTISRMGGRLPLHATGVGQALLAFQTDGFLRSYVEIARNGSTAQLVQGPRIRADVERIRSRGFALTSQEMALGTVSIAVPIRDGGGTVLAAVGLVLGQRRADVQRHLPLLRRAAAGISSAFRAARELDSAQRD